MLFRNAQRSALMLLSQPLQNAPLANSARLLCVTSRGLHNPRTLKRRNSPFASHDCAARQNSVSDYTPVLLAPLPIPERKIYKKID